MKDIIASTQEPMSLANAHEWKNLAQKWQARAMKAEGELAQYQKICWWTMSSNGGWFDTGCGSNYYELSVYCPGCGHRAEVQP